MSRPGVGVFAEGQPIARSDVLRRRLTEPWLQQRITGDQLYNIICAGSEMRPLNLI